ncbi:MAG: FtsX-like permease family protein, partial [Gemmatimonadaceae bacterium]
RQLLTESVLLAVGGTVLGVALAPLLLRLLGALMPPRLAGLAPAQLDWRVLGFAALLAVGTGIAIGLWPAAGSSRANLGETVNGGSGHGTTAAGAGLTRRLLVGAELALTLMLLIGSALMLRSFAKLMSVDSGLNPAHVATLEMSFGIDAKMWPARLARVQEMLDRLSAVPGIEAVGAVNDLPLGKEGGISLRVTTQEAPSAATSSPTFYFARYLIASGGYFKAMGIALVKGRTFTPADDSLAPVAVIDRAMADTVWPHQSPIGRRFSPGMVANGQATDYTVIGVVDNVRVSGLDQPPGLQMYFSMGQQMPMDLTVVARGTLPPAALMARLRDVVRAVDPSQAVHRVRMMDDVVNTSVAPRRANTLLIALFGVLALVLAALGVYAVVSYSVAQRRREFGIRAALGATGRNLTSLAAREVLWVLVLGIGVGLAGAWAASRVLASLLFGVTTHDLATFVLAPLALIIPAAIATLIPARRAARTNPMDVVREE